jgi:hypothetical protein
MKKFFAFATALFLLAASGWAQTTSQDAPKHRQHTRPPYSGPRKANGGKAHLPPRTKHTGKPGPRPVGKSDHIIVR